MVKDQKDKNKPDNAHAPVSPSGFMRKHRPEYYSDSKEKSSYSLDAATLAFQLDTITQRNQTQDFEIFCRKLCERVICPNLRPQTGPEGGGDSKADSETYPVAEEVSLVYLGEPNSGKERWAFAFSAKAKWAEKVRADVKAIVGTDRTYDRIICVTSRAARSKDRANLEDELSKKYGIPVTIHDRSWIVKEVIDGDRKDLAFNYLHVGQEVNMDQMSGIFTRLRTHGKIGEVSGRGTKTPTHGSSKRHKAEHGENGNALRASQPDFLSA